MLKNILEYLELDEQLYPDKIAIADENERYSFSRLKREARLLGGILAEYKVRHRPIGVLANRKASVGLSFLGVLYSGNYYVPIDPSMPELKIQAILEDANIEILIGDEKNRNLLRRLNYNGIFVSLSNLEESSAIIGIPSIEDEEPLYMVYTSGSTGKPKGVVKSHSAMISFIEAYTQTFDFDDTDIIGNQTPLFFDASAKDFYLMLKTGATLEILPSKLFTLPVTLIRYLNEKNVTFISWVPSALSIVTQLNTFLEVLPKSLKRVFFVGEVFPIKQLNKWRGYLPDLQYVNLYGSSEIAGICCYYKIRGEITEGDCLPLGKPLKNCEVFLIDNGEIITQSDKTGEIYIASPALASSYFKDQKKTDECFLNMNMPDGTQKRMFKTGDLARYNANKDLVFVSRIDYQIKHMGRRIELGEIEAAANALLEVQKCGCLYQQKQKKIVLFCEVTDDFTGDEQAIKSELKEKLSDYMLPAKVIILDKLPLNANGKIDREQLKQLLEGEK